MRPRLECYAEGCREQIPRTRLMCREHWCQVPKHLRDRVWEAFRHGGAQEYLDAINAAQDAVEAASQAGRR